MKFLSYKFDNRDSFGVLTKEQDYVIDLQDFSKQESLLELIISAENNKSVIDEIKLLFNDRKLFIPITKIEITSPIPVPRRNIICLGLNYLDHAKESEQYKDGDFKLPQAPVYFSKMAASTIGHNDNLELDEELTKKLDYEVELALIIGKTGTNISKEDVYDHIFGFTIMNDFTARDLQSKHTQWFKGKSLDNYTSLGPVITHVNKFQRPLSLYLRTYVNGELRQTSNTKHLIYSIEDIISDFSRGITLLPGDIIATGTPAGVGMGMKPPKFLSKGDIVVCEVEGIGMLSNTII